jgi:thiol-disulfide isomerase/thioredoxin
MIDIENNQSELQGTMRIVGRVIASAFFLTVSAFGLPAGEVVVLQGGARIELQKPPVRQGNVVLLTRSDGLLLSVHAADIDWKATAAARDTARAPAKEEAAVQAPPERPAQAKRAGRDGPKVRLKLTDADVAHVAEEEPVPGEKGKKGSEARSGVARLKVAEYAQEKVGGKPILYDFTAAWCPPCHRLDTEGLSDPQIASLVSSTYLLSRVVDRKREDGINPPAIDELEGRYSVNAFPTLVVATPDGRLIARLEGYPGRKGLLHFLQESSRKTP